MAPKKKVVENPKSTVKKTVAAPKKAAAAKTKAAPAKAVIKAEPKSKTLVPKKEAPQKAKEPINRVVMSIKTQTGEGWRRSVLRQKKAKKS